ncbi:MAG: tRNA dihydrouridine synthase DusB [Fidelibacterota bacterium]
MKPLIIGSIRLDTPILLAPMAGVTDYAFRILCREFGAAMVYSEFVSAHGIIRENAKTLDLIRFTPEERPIGIQIFGDRPDVMAQAAGYVQKTFQPDLVDINYGCPVPKVTRKGAGSAALRDLCLMDDITAAVVEAVPEIPVTVKMRAGWDSRSIVIPEVGQRLERAGVAAITLHPRTTVQKYTGKADWPLIRELKQAVDIPVIGNGDIESPEDVVRMLDETGCDGVMIGRAALGNPWIFTQIMQYLNGNPISDVTLPERVRICNRHLDLMIMDKGERIALNLMKKHFGWYIKGYPGAATDRKHLVMATELTEIRALLRQIEQKS